MNAQRFVAPNSREAMALARAAFGEQAVILSTRSTEQGFEVVATSEDQLSAIAAQVGTMVVQEEVAALEVMSISPVRFLVMPRLAAMMIMMPLLTVFTNMLGILGGAIVGYTQLGVSIQAYFDNAQMYVVNKDLYTGLFKALLFGIIIAIVACHQGFSARQGAVGVGQATRRTVIISFLTILVTGYIVTRFLYE